MKRGVVGENNGELLNCYVICGTDENGVVGGNNGELLRHLWYGRKMV